MGKREEAIDVIEEYAWYHGGTATVTGFLGGQFGADGIALSVLTARMIFRICEIYEITDTSARNIHVLRALGTLTVQGNAIGRTILNWIPMGSFANGFASYFLTKRAGIQCINDIESDQMNVGDQIVHTAKDIIVTSVSHGALGELIDIGTEGITESHLNEIIDICESDNKFGSVINDFLDQIPSEVNAGLDKAIGTAIKETLKSSLNSRTGTINTKNIVRNVFLNSFIAAIDEHNRFTPEEIDFRMLQRDDYYKTFEPFFESTSKMYDSISDERDGLESIKSLLKATSDFMSVKVGTTSEQLMQTMLDNPYDRAIENTYKSYLTLIEPSSNIGSVISKAVLLYIRLKTINLEYHWPTSELNKTDDGLIFMIAGRIKDTIQSPILDPYDQRYIAFLISQQLRNHSRFYTPEISYPIWGIDKQCLKDEYDRLINSIIDFWHDIIGKNTDSVGIWSDCGMAAVQAHQLKDVFLSKFTSTSNGKDKELISHIASGLKQQQPILDRYTNQEVSYYTEMYFDKFYDA